MGAKHALVAGNNCYVGLVSHSLCFLTSQFAYYRFWRLNSHTSSLRFWRHNSHIYRCDTVSHHCCVLYVMLYLWCCVILRGAVLCCDVLLWFCIVCMCVSAMLLLRYVRYILYVCVKVVYVYAVCAVCYAGCGAVSNGWCCYMLCVVKQCVYV